MLETFLLPPVPTEVVPETLMPHVNVIDADDFYGKLAVEPLQRGFGLTIGNPLRRILLSSTTGSAITWVKIEDVVHEYTAILGIKEEVMELLLNIKRIRVRAQSGRAGKMRLDVTGEGRVCAGDIATSSDFEIVNPELHLATLDSKDSHLAIEFNVEQGVGYQPAAQGDGTTNPPVGVLPVDAVFSPVRKVNYSVERTRVGQITDFERLVLEIWTDGTVSPVEALRLAADRMVDHFFLFANLDRATEAGIERPSLVVSPEIYQTPIDRLDLSPRTLNCLKRAHIAKVGEVLEMSNDDLLKIRNFGEKSLVELRDKLAARGISGQGGGAADPLAAIGELDSEGEESMGITDLTPEDIGELMGGNDAVAGPAETGGAAGVYPGDEGEEQGEEDVQGEEESEEEEEEFE